MLELRTCQYALGIGFLFWGQAHSSIVWTRLHLVVASPLFLWEALVPKGFEA